MIEKYVINSIKGNELNLNKQKTNIFKKLQLEIHPYKDNFYFWLCIKLYYSKF